MRNIWKCERFFLSLAGAGLKFNADEMDPKQVEYVRCSAESAPLQCLFIGLNLLNFITLEFIGFIID